MNPFNKSRRKYFICDNCPCLNNDYEQGALCNLDFGTDLEWVRISDKVIVDDTPEMRSHQQDFDLKNVSFDCELIEIKTSQEIIKPEIVTIEDKSNA